jgi:hypothetical protein
MNMIKESTDYTDYTDFNLRNLYRTFGPQSVDKQDHSGRAIAEFGDKPHSGLPLSCAPVARRDTR